MSRRRIKLKKGEKKPAYVIAPGKIVNFDIETIPSLFTSQHDVINPLAGRHYDTFVCDDLVSDPPAVASNAPQDIKTAELTLQHLKQAVDTLRDYHVNHYLMSSSAWFITVPPQLKNIASWILGLDRTIDAKEFRKNMDLYRNVIETEFGVKLCVKENVNTDMVSMEILVPTKLFAADDGREKLANALASIAQFVMNMDDPDRDAVL